MTQPFSADATMRRLKDFQRQTVDYVFRRLYLDSDPAKRFLVADEVGLGKTLVARGVIARALEHLEDKIDRIDFVYVCSNAAIAHQNVARLNVLGRGGFALASRLTLLPTQVAGLRRHRVNFVSFTPGTTFDLKSRSGIMQERSLIYRMLRGGDFADNGLMNLLQGPAGRQSWEAAAHRWSYPIDADLGASFLDHVRRDEVLSQRIHEVSERFHRYREDVPSGDSNTRYDLIGDLRQRLARVCLNALEPDLVILDEFQRFRNLLREDDPTAELAQALFDYPNVRVLLLSATPYKMLSLDHEQHDDHYPDFLRTLRFLLGNDDAVSDVQSDIEEFRRALLELNPERPQGIAAARDALRAHLHAVMCRTERVSSTATHDAMLCEPPRPATLKPADLAHARVVDGASRLVGARDAIEYWKSAPYAVNMMKGYELRRRMDALPAETAAQLATFLHEHREHLLQRAQFEGYRPVDPANARLRVLLDDTIERGLARVLWMPPSLPTWRPEGPFASLDSVTKSLVFSAWNVVPDAIAALCSYEAERRAVSELNRVVPHSELYDAVKPLLRFSESDGRLTGMPALLLMYPSPSLAALVDPVTLSLEKGDEVPELAAILRQVEIRLADIFGPLLADHADAGRADERWYWAAPAWLDARAYGEISAWVATWGTADANAEDAGSSFRAHADQLGAAIRGPGGLALGRPPDDLVAVLAMLALAGPAVCALRSLRRAAPGLGWDQPALLDAASTVAAGFRTLFNVPESIAVLRADDTSDRYWLLTLDHGLHGNLGALLDEQVHVLAESLGVADADEATRVGRIAAELRDSLSIRTSQLHVDELRPRPRLGTVERSTFKLRCRFALRFGEMKDEKGEARAETVRSAFNSPFRPFVLASTSVGQEGLDFHLWCHAVVHWNLPSNPVDLEQREGRVHRYKGHAVRKNVATELGRAVLRKRWEAGFDPWRVLFEEARASRGSDLRAFWLFETDGGAKVERRVPLLPLSRDGVQLARLKRGLALYRLVFGQPRQEDLLAHLGERLSAEDIDRVVAEWRIDLSPPAPGRSADNESGNP
jgi:hypothetical protein